MESNICYSIIIPMYNEEAVIEETYRRLKRVMKDANGTYELLFINDGSQDKCADIIKQFMIGDKTVKLIDFSRNFGHQIAITAGMDYANGDAVIIIDADLQDPPELILQMIEKWKEGYEVVYAKRMKRKGETWFKKWSASTFYRVLRASTDIDIPVDTGDFRLMDQKVCKEMRKINENNRFVRGLVSWIGFRQIAIEYVRDERVAGETKYPLKRMVKLCLDGILSFSYKPLKLAIYSGLLLSSSGFLYFIYVLYLTLFTEVTMKGWPSIISIMLIFNGFMLFMLGVIGEYIGRIYDETKGRPLYIVREFYGEQESEKLAIQHETAYE
ncbi:MULTISPECIES: glycosyltransferase family 2 protein [Bacillus]|nr:MULTISPECIES: glycosyltransferase family 2 protein [Bacillus]MBK5424298.1 glycosyltransferase family 2 protein [Bacillus sp. TH30]MBK5469130.1 glycosyltransferase family 2 protein [Bacillus sp. TH19]MED1383847.1 glycosyltransferase family 2 protein [Bacillus mycoides]QBP90134.1 glycosyltransferase [Bacillus mycoides]QWH75811.1 glycosyltransferase [Bacillus mycoides]